MKWNLPNEFPFQHLSLGAFRTLSVQTLILFLKHHKLISFKYLNRSGDLDCGGLSVVECWRRMTTKCLWCNWNNLLQAMHLVVTKFKHLMSPHPQLDPEGFPAMHSEIWHDVVNIDEILMFANRIKSKSLAFRVLTIQINFRSWTSAFCVNANRFSLMFAFALFCRLECWPIMSTWLHQNIH